MREENMRAFGRRQTHAVLKGSRLSVDFFAFFVGTKVRRGLAAKRKIVSTRAR